MWEGIGRCVSRFAGDVVGGVGGAGEAGGSRFAPHPAAGGDFARESKRCGHSFEPFGPTQPGLCWVRVAVEPFKEGSGELSAVVDERVLVRSFDGVRTRGGSGVAATVGSDEG